MSGNKDLNFPGSRRADWQIQPSVKGHPTNHTFHISGPSTQSNSVAQPRLDAAAVQNSSATAVRPPQSVQVVELDDDDWDGWEVKRDVGATINSGPKVSRDELRPERVPADLVDSDCPSDDSAGSISPGKMVVENISSDGLVVSDVLDDESRQQSSPAGDPLFPNSKSHGSKSGQSTSASLPPVVSTQSSENAMFRVPSTSIIPPRIAHQINAWCQKHRLLQPPPITSTAKYDTLTATKSGRSAHFVYKTGAPIEMYKYPLGEKSNLLVAQVHGRYPVAIYPTKKWEGKAHSGCTYYRTWIGLDGDKDGFADDIEFAKCFTPDFVPSLFASTLASGELPRAKKGELSSSTDFHGAEELPGSASQAKSEHRVLTQRGPRAAQQAEVLEDAGLLTRRCDACIFRQSQCDLKHPCDMCQSKGTWCAYERPEVDANEHVNNGTLPAARKKRKRADSEFKETEDQSLIRDATTKFTPWTAELPLNTTNNKHIRRNTVLLFFSAHSPTPRVRLLHVCDTAKELFAQALAGGLFDEPLDRGDGDLVLLATLGPSRRVMRLLGSDEKHYWNLFVAIKVLPCWVAMPGGGVEGSCTVEIRAMR